MDKERRINRRLMAFGPFAVAGALLLGLSGADAQTEGEGTPRATTTAGPSITVSAQGDASAPANGAVILLVLRWNDLSQAPPTSGKGDAESDQKAGGPAPAGSAPVTAADAQPVVDALVAGGIPTASIEIVETGTTALTGPFGAGTVQVLATVDERAAGALGSMIPAAVAAAITANLWVDQTGVGYTVSDCTTVETEALRDAVMTGQAQAQQLADVLGVQLGALQVASRQPGYSIYGGAAACGEPLTTAQVKEGKVYLPAFNPASPAEFEVYAMVSLTYAIA